MSTNPNYKPSEGKREEFRKYLEKNGVMDALTKVLVSLYEEVDKPQDALAFIRDKLAIEAGLETFDQMTEKLQDSEKKIKDLEEQIAGLTAETIPPEQGEEQPPTEPGEEQPPALEGGEEAPPAPPAEEEQAAPVPAPVVEEAPPTEEAPPNPPPEV